MANLTGRIERKSYNSALSIQSQDYSPVLSVAPVVEKIKAV